MNSRLRQILGTGTLVVASVLALGAAGVAADDGPTLAETVALGEASSARVEVEVGVGRLRLTGGSLAGAGTPMPIGQLLRGEFTYDDDTFAPTIDYAIEDGAGHLTLTQEGSSDGLAWPWDDRTNDWALYLNPTVPTDLSVALGAGESELALGGLTLTRLDVSTGAAKTTLDFEGDWRADLQAKIESGAGELTLRLPRDIGVRVQVDSGVGEVDADGFTEEDGAYVNDAYGVSPVTLEIDVANGAGEVELELVG